MGILALFEALLQSSQHGLHCFLMFSTCRFEFPCFLDENMKSFALIGNVGSEFRDLRGDLFRHERRRSISGDLPDDLLNTTLLQQPFSTNPAFRIDIEPPWLFAL